MQDQMDSDFVNRTANASFSYPVSFGNVISLLSLCFPSSSIFCEREMEDRRNVWKCGKLEKLEEQEKRSRMEKKKVKIERKKERKE